MEGKDQLGFSNNFTDMFASFGSFFSKGFSEIPEHKATDNFFQPCPASPPQREPQVFQKPKQPPEKPKPTTDFKFSLKRDPPKKPDGDSKRPKLDFLSSPAPSIKPSQFISAKKSFFSKPQVVPKTPLIPPHITPDDNPLPISHLEEDKRQIQEIHQAFECIESLSSQTTFSNLSEMNQIREELPSLILSALNLRLRQLELMNKLLTCGVPELKSLACSLESFDESIENINKSH